jgi:hypothetical protein
MAKAESLGGPSDINEGGCSQPIATKKVSGGKSSNLPADRRSSHPHGVEGHTSQNDDDPPANKIRRDLYKKHTTCWHDIAIHVDNKLQYRKSSQTRLLGSGQHFFDDVEVF